MNHEKFAQQQADLNSIRFRLNKSKLYYFNHMKRNFVETFEDSSKKDLPKDAFYQAKSIFRDNGQVWPKETQKKVHDENLRVLKQNFPDIKEEVNHTFNQ